MPSIVPMQIVQWALDDKYPYHWGAMMTVAVVTSRMRQCEQGDRRQWVDLLTELREGHPHAHAVLAKRFAKTSSLPWELVRPETKSAADEARAEMIARFVEGEIKRIPSWKQHVHGLCWAGFNGASSREIMWGRDSDGIHVESLRLVHTRRIGFGNEFKPYIENGSMGSQRIDPAAYPGKFIMHLPSMADEHPTRTGLGRVLAYWMSFGRFVNRSWLNYTERFGNPFPVATWRTNREEDGVATDEEIESAKQLVKDIGRGSQPGWAGPDTIKLEIFGPGGKSSGGGSGENTNHKAYLAFINAEISKAVEGGDLNTESRQTGSRALGESQADDAASMAVDDAGQLDETITRDLVRWIVEFNFGADAARRLCPTYHTVVQKPEDRKYMAEIIATAKRDCGMRVPAKWAHEKLSIPQPQDGEAVLGEEDGDEQGNDDNEPDGDNAEMTE